MTDCFEIGACPTNEWAVQVSTEGDYLEAMQNECERFKAMLHTRYPFVPKEAIGLKIYPHEFGRYIIVAINFIDEEGKNFARFIENTAPLTWDDLKTFTIEDYEKWLQG